MLNHPAMKRFSVIIPSWKNLAYLDVAYRGLVRNSAVEHEIIVFFNEADADCRRWLEGKNVIAEFSEKNVGVCEAVNRAARRASTDFICFLNDDMYPLPGWDTALWQYIDIAPVVWLSGTAVEPGRQTPCNISRDYGHGPDDFQEQKVLAECGSLKRLYNVVSTWTPTVIRKKDWDAVGGFDEKYFPGNGSDPDLAMKMYVYGCRHYIGVGTSLVYHFARSTISRFDRVEAMDPKAYFKSKWGISWKRFFKYVMCRDSVIDGRLLAKVCDDTRWTASRVLGRNRK